MKNFNKLAIFTFAMFGFAVTANAQSSDETTATASATVVAPIAIETVGNLVFGEVKSSSTIGDVIVTADGARSGSAVSGTALNSAFSAAKFKVTGQSGYAYSVSFPAASITISTPEQFNADGTPVVGSIKSMTVDTFTTTLDAASKVGNINTNAVSFGVGATLKVGIDQTAGDYTGSFAVTVNYN